MIGFEIIFTISIVTKFLEEFLKDGQLNPIRDLKQIAERYLQTDFVWDFVPIIPFPFIFNIGGIEQHLYMIKCVRMFSGLRIFNT